MTKGNQKKKTSELVKKSFGQEKSLSDNKKSIPLIKPDKSQFPIVGIGASAGGLEAIEEFLKNMPEGSGIALVIIQHLDPNSKGMLQELLQRTTTMKVFTATDHMTIKPNSVYVIPPNKNISILNGALHLFEPIAKRGLRLPIDYFFSSLADDRQEKSIGIILSGMGADGTMGLKSIKEKGGFTLVQSPDSAKFDSMPRNAIELVTIDIIASAIDLPEKLLKILKQPLSKQGPPEPEKDNSALEKIIIQLRERTGNDFSYYKKSTLYRRIERRMGTHKIDKISNYVQYIQENPVEADILFRELLIGVTSFFRDPAVWDYLRDETFPLMFNQLSDKQVLRAWVPACSTGEEAYSLAITFKEALEKWQPENRFSLQIFATDLDSQAIENGRKAIFPASIEANVSQERLHKFFLREGNTYKVRGEIREMVVFAVHNVAKDPPFTKLEFLSCRNMLIYMETILQKKVMSLFRYSLSKTGILILGNAESINSLSNLFIPVGSKLRIYKCSDITNKPTELIPYPELFTHSKSLITAKQPEMIPENLQSLTEQLLLQQFSPTGILINSNGDILYFVGSTGAYLEPAVGKANMNIFFMAHNELRHVLAAAIRKASKNYQRIVLNNLKVKIKEGRQLTTVTIQQIEKPLALKGKILILFKEESAQESKTIKSKIGKQKSSAFSTDLQHELNYVREELNNTTEEMQTSQEELTSTNEELQSTNEELQSTNEELTTSKEEMQSLNEELQTLNTQLQIKIDDSARISNDMNNLLNSSEIATLFLDKDLKIRHFTPAATGIFKMQSTDTGRLYTDQTSNLDYPTMHEDAKAVIRTLVFVEKSISATDGRWFKVRIMPYRTSDDKIDGLVITFIDITSNKKLENALLEAQANIKQLMANQSKTEK